MANPDLEEGRAPGGFVGLHLKGSLKAQMTQTREGILRHLAAILPAGTYMSAGSEVEEALPLLGISLVTLQLGTSLLLLAPP